MDQDDLEDELIWKTVVAHFDMATEKISYRLRGALGSTESLIAITLGAIVIVGWVLRSSRLSRSLIQKLLLMQQDVFPFGAGDTWQHSAGAVAAFAMQGRRPGMEDRFYTAAIEVPGCSAREKVLLSAVLDGHGGHYAADHVRKQLATHLETKIRVLKYLSKRDAPKRERIKYFLSQMPKGTKATKGILRAVDMTEAEYREIDPRGIAKDTEEQNKEGKQQRSPKTQTTPNSTPPTFLASTRTKALEETPIPPKRGLKGDKGEEEEAEEESKSKPSMEDLLCLNYGGVGGPKAKTNSRGSSPPSNDLSDYLSPSTGRPLYSRLLRDEIEAADLRLLEDARRARQIGGTTLLVSVLDGSEMWVANVGDCRGVMGSGVAEVTSLSYDHKPSQLKEKKRIQEAGGFVSMNGVWRVQGILATSRALGDYPLKDQKLITAEPDVLHFDLAKVRAPRFALLASDGLWDALSNDAAAAFLSREVARAAAEKGPTRLLRACKALSEEAFHRDSSDNITVVAVDLAAHLANISR